jgi:hypothetical protein
MLELRYVAHAIDVPLHEPPQPLKKKPLAAAARTVIVESVRTVMLHSAGVVGQSTESLPGPPVTVPFAGDASATPKVLAWTTPLGGLKTAVAIAPEVDGATAQFTGFDPQLLASSCQPLNVQPELAAAVRFTVAVEL